MINKLELEFLPVHSVREQLIDEHWYTVEHPQKGYDVCEWWIDEDGARFTEKVQPKTVLCLKGIPLGWSGKQDGEKKKG